VGIRGALSFAMLAAVLGAPVSSAAQYVLVERDVQRAPRPDGLTPDDGSRRNDAILFHEEDHVLEEGIAFDIEPAGSFTALDTIRSCGGRGGEAGDFIQSHHVLLHPNDARTRRIVLLFTGRVIGMQTSGACLATGDGIFGAPSVGTAGYRGLDFGPGDLVTMFRGGQGIAIELAVEPWAGPMDGSDWDDARLIVKPATGPFSPQTELGLGCRIVGEDATTVDIELEARVIAGTDVRDATLLALLPEGSMPTSPLPAECEFSDVHGLIHCFEPDARGVGVTPHTVTITRGLGGLLVAGIVTPDEEMGYENNRCPLDIAADWMDGGVPDSGAPDGAMPRDSATPPDSTIDVDTSGGGGADGVMFRGVGGCACRAAPSGRDVPTLAILLVAALLVLRRKEPS